MNRPHALSIGIAIASTWLMAAANTAWAQEPSAACALKRQDIETQISHAKAAGRSQQVAGLEKALAANLAHCSDASLEQERQEAIAKAQREVTEREQDLAEAVQKGDPKKISSRNAKLEEARQELAEAQKPVPR